MSQIDDFLDSKAAPSVAPKVSAIDAFLGEDKPKAPGLARGAADTAIAGATGLVSGVQMLSNVAGADNPVSRGLGKANEFLADLESPYRKAEKQERAKKIKAAEESGSTWEEVKAYGGAFAEAPLDTTVNALGTSVPTLAAAFLTGGASVPAQVAARALPKVIGVAQGTGAVKGQIYEAVEQEHLKAGKTPEEAAARAADAQAYDGKNVGQIALGGVLGGVASGIGAEAAIRRFVSGKVAGEAGKDAAMGIGKAAGLGVLKETPVEMLQGGQERVASNLALQNEGFDTPTWRGVGGQAFLDGLASAPMGAGFGMLDARGLPTVNPNTAVEPPAQPPAPQPPNYDANALQALQQTRLDALASEEAGAPDVPQVPPPDGAAALAAQTERANRARQAMIDLSRATESPDDEILQSTGMGTPPMKPSVSMGIDPNAGVISKVAAEAVDGPASMEMAVRQAEREMAALAAEDNPEAGADPKPTFNDPLEAQVAAYVAEMGDASPQMVAAKFGVTIPRAAELLAQADPTVDDLFPPPQGAANVSNTDAAGAVAAGTGGPVGVDADGGGPDAGLLEAATGQRPAGTAGAPAPAVQEGDAAPVPGRDSDPALTKGPINTKAKVGGLKELIARNKAAKANVQDQPQAAAAEPAPAPAPAVQAPPPVGSDGAAQPGAATAGRAGVEADGVASKKQEFKVEGADPHTVSYAQRPDGRLVRTINYPDGQSSTDTLVTDKKGDETWVSNDRYAKGEFYPKQLSSADAEQAIREDMAGKPVAPTPSPTTTEPTNAPRSPEATQAVETAPQGRQETALLSDTVSAEPNLEAAKALLARQRAATGNAVDYKGFERVPKGNGVFELRDGNMTVTVEPTSQGKYQASFRGAKSSPHLMGEQGAVNWAEAFRKDGAKEKAGSERAPEKLATPDKMTPRQFDDWIRQRATIQTEQFRGDRNHGGGDEGVGYIHLSGEVEAGGTNWAGTARGSKDKRDTRLVFRTDDNKIVWYDTASQQAYEVPKDDARLEITRPEPVPKQARNPQEITVTVDGSDYTVTFDEPLATISDRAFEDNLDEYGTYGSVKPEFRKLRAQAQAGGAATPSTGARRDPTKVSMFNPYIDGDIVTIDGQDWTVKADTPGWYLTTTGNWRGQHPTIRNVKAMADLIREVEQAAEAKPAAAQAEAPKLTQAEAKDLMEWQDLGQKDGIKTHILTFYESKADKDAKRGRMTIATVSKEVDSKTWVLESNGEKYAMLGFAKKRAEEAGMAKAVADGFVAAAPAQQEAQQATDDRDTFTLKRLNRETGRMQPVTFKRGEYVEVTLIGSDKKDYGEIDGISQARREFSVNGLWHTMGAAYKAERPAAPARKDVAPLSKVIDKVNAKNGDGLTDADRVPEQKPASKTPAIDAHNATMAAVREGKATAEQFKASFEAVVASKEAIKSELDTMTKVQLLREGGPFVQMRYANEKKAEVVDAVYRQIVGEYALGETVSYGMGKGAYEAAIRRMVDAADDAKLAAYVAERKTAIEEALASRAARAAAIDNPQTLNDYREAINVKVREGMTRKEAFLTLTPEQRIKYDTLEAEGTREAREARKRSLKTQVRAADQTTGGQIIATKHTKNGYDLFVVQLSDRLSREDYQTVLASAKKLGGWYSAFRGNGAVPGFQFKDRANADAFLALAGGDTAAAQEQVAQRRDAFEDDRSQTAVERLRAMADKLDAQAAEVEGRERKTNTARRARFASAALNAAAADKAKAKTMRNIADGIEAGKAKFLDEVRTKSQVDMLTSIVDTAKGNELRAKYPSYADQEKRKGEPPTAETADFAEFPSYGAFRSDLATLGRQLLEVDGTKKLGQRLMSVADDVTDAYLEFAKANFRDVSQFGRGDSLADFASKDEAERAIKRSGLTGKAIVLPIKRGQNRVILSPSEAIGRGVWQGDGDKRITLTVDFGNELVEAIGRRGNKANRLSVPWQFQNAYDRRKALARIGIETPSEYRSALREFINLKEQAVANRTRELELQMVGRKADGLDFFPTSAEVADQMVDAADLSPDMAVLEPSAGMGHLADRIREAGAEPDVIEISPDRRELLEEKGYHLADVDDFMQMEPRKFFTYGDVFRAPDGTEGIMRGGNSSMGSDRVMLVGEDGRGVGAGFYNRSELIGVRHRGTDSGYDRIIMNPPFSNRRDAEHVRHAYDLLKPGGRIVAIMGEGVFFGQDKKAQDFRDWLDSVGGTSEKLPEGSFMDPSLPVNTAVNARMVVIDKPAANTADVVFSQSLAPVAPGQSVTRQQAEEVVEKAVADGFVEAAATPMSKYDTEARTYGYQVAPDGKISKGDKALSPVVKEVRGRLRVEAPDGKLLFSGATTPEAFGEFLRSFWGAEKAATGDTPMFSRAKAKEIRNLVTLHNMTEANLEYSDSLGGMPVPSLGITKVDAPFSGFGNITLIGDKNLADPEQGVPVFDRDAWTARFPTMNFKKPRRAKADAFYERMKAMTKGIGVDEGNFLSNLWDSMVNASVTNPDKVASHFQSYDAPRLAYARDVLERPIKVPMRAASRNFDFSADAKLLAYWKKNGDALNRMYREMSGPDFYALPQFHEFSDEVKAAINRAWSDSERNEKSLANLRGMYLESMFDKDGVLYPADFRKMGADFEKIGVKEVDRMKLRDALDKVVKPNDPAYLRWVQEQVKPLFDAPTITLRGKEVEPTLDNIVESMTTGAVQGVEKSMTFGPGKLAAHLGKRFKSLAEIKAARDQVVSESAESEAKKATDALLDEFRTHVAQFFTFKDWRGNIDTWAANDASMEALARAGKQGLTDANIRLALARKDFKGVDQRGVDLARQAIEALRDTATNYFEAKPQRAVKISEFKGAVVPKDISPESLAILEKNGVTVEFYGKADGAREKAIEKLAKRLDRQSGDVVFSRAAAAGSMPIQTAQQIVDTITARWKNAPEVVVVESVQDPRVPEAVRRADAAQRSQGATGEPEGFWYGGKAYIVSGALDRPADVARVLFHEVLGHYGLRGTFGDGLKPILAQIANMRKSEVQAKAAEYGLDMEKESDRLQAAEEVLAVMAQANPQAGFVKRAIGAIRAWLRENVPGLQNMRLTDNDIVTQFILPARRFVQQGPAARVGDGVLAMSRSAGDVTDTPAFRKWFGDSKVVDADGKPLVVYHGTAADFDAFRTEGGFSGVLGEGSYFTSKPNDASNYAGRQEGSRVLPVYVSIKRPYMAPGLMTPDGAARIRESGEYDGIIAQRRDSVIVVPFKPEQIKSAIGNNGQFDPSNPDIRFSRSPRELAGMATDQIKMTLTAPGKLSWWSKTVGTMYGLAERHPAFKPVFNAAQSFIDDVSYYATDAADMAPKMLPKLENWRDIAKSPISAEDNKAIEGPVNEGTLLWARDESGRPVKVAELEAQAATMTADQKARRLLRNDKISDGVLKMWQGLPQEQYEKLIESRYESQMLAPGVVWTDAELKAIWKLNDTQIGLYREVRAAIDKSLDNLAKSDLVRFVGKDGAGIKDAIMEAGTVDEAALMARDYFIGLSEAEPDRAEMLLATANGIMDRADKVGRLKQQGYAPLSRFGKYTVDVVTEEGRQYFGLFESMREANQMAVRMRGEFGKDAVSQGTLSDESFKLFQGITPETLELFGNMLGLSDTGDTPQDQAFQAYLKLTKNNRSAMKRLIQRKGILGYSQDVGRVLANFIYSNARQTAAALHIGDLTEAINAIPQGQGEVKDVAVKLGEYIKNPQEEAQAFRGLLFAQYLGGNISSAIINALQPFQVSFPYLSQFGGVKQAGAEMLRATKEVATGKKQLDPELAAAIKRGEDDGTLSPQEVFQLMAQAKGAGSLRSGDGTLSGDLLAKGGNAWSKTALAWGKVFGVAEQFNRRSTFIAAYRIAKTQKIADPFAFAKKTVQETQFIYSKANRPQWARGAIGATVFTFKTYSISYIELLHRMATQGGPEGKRAALLAVAVLLLMGGAGGLPFMEDGEDIADTIAQVMGYNFSSKQAKQELLEELFGEAAAQFIDKGISGVAGVPIDVSGRFGMGNLIPGTGAFLQRNSNARDVLEVLGPAGDLIQRGKDSIMALAKGNVYEAGLNMSPAAIRNLAKGADMADTGMYRDTKGFKVIESTGAEAALKAIGFQPNTVAQVQEANYLMQRQKDYYNATAQNIRAKWARGLFEKDEGMVAEAREAIDAWNEKNPDQRMSPNMPAIWKRVREMSKDKDQRIADTAPKAMRQQFREETARVRESL